MFVFNRNFFPFSHIFLKSIDSQSAHRLDQFKLVCFMMFSATVSKQSMPREPHALGENGSYEEKPPGLFILLFFKD